MVNTVHESRRLLARHDQLAPKVYPHDDSRIDRSPAKKETLDFLAGSQGERAQASHV